ncbi:MAG: hypothetical protein AAF517_10295 [Planctomycetota bacterium]
MATQPLQQPNSVLSFAAASAGGDEYPNDDRTGLLVMVASGASGNRTVTLQVQRPSVSPPGYGALTVESKVVTLAAGEMTELQGLVAPFNDATGKAMVTYDNHADVLIAPVRLDRP